MRHLTRTALLALALVVTACSPATDEASVPSITVSGQPDSQRSLAPGEVLGARQEAGIDACPASDAKATQREGGLPAVTLDCLGGDSTVNLAGLPTGKPRVINIWAQWCQPCAEEAPSFAQVARETRGQVDFLGINYGDPFVGKAIDFAVEHQTLYPQLVDPEQTVRAPLKVPGPPQTYFVDAQGTLVHHSTTVYKTPDALRADVEKYLGVTAS
ncbi:TlpA family protein disulfide reductase [Luteococcus sp. Sow4_B9]|uniref:TlpA family protein disulfide reductase n=1 Tax=Luteococcus sp. Sow4_B9 TaxID=3438792 RepID=UPI003F99DC2B